MKDANGRPIEAMPRDPCANCIYNEERCEVPPGYPHSEATKKLCQDAGWRVVFVRRAQSSAPTGRWAEYLEGR